MYDLVISNFNRAVKMRNSVFFVKHSKKNIYFLKALYKYGLIAGFECLGMLIKVFLKHSSTIAPVKKIVKVSSALSPVIVKAKHLNAFQSKGSLCLVSTNKGVVDLVEAKQNFSGGVIICFIY